MYSTLFMKSFTVIISIYNSAMDFMVTCIGSKPYRFKVETIIGEPHATVLKLLPGHEWVAEHVSVKYFTKDNIRRLGALIEGEKPKWILN
jgi:hypothetical protein